MVIEITQPYVLLLFFLWMFPFLLSEQKIVAFLNVFSFTFVFILYLITDGIEVSLITVYLTLLFHFTILGLIGVTSVLGINTLGQQKK